MTARAMLLAALLPACAADPAASSLALRQDVEATLTGLRAAYAQRDGEALRGFYSASPEFEWVENGAVRYRSVDEVAAAVAALPADAQLETTWDDTVVTPIGVDLALARTNFTTSMRMPDGGAFSFGGMITMLLRREAGRVRVLRGHTSSPVPRGR